jgi:hypothetical protein
VATETKSNTFDKEFRKVLGPAGVILDKNDTVQQFNLGSIAYDDRGSEYVYLLGVASMVQFAWVNYRLLGDLTTAVALATTTTVDLRDPIAVACAATVANEYGWFQIKGPAYARYLTSMALSGTVQSTSTAGVMDDANTTTVIGAKCDETEGGTGTDNLKTWLQYPHAGIAL